MNHPFTLILVLGSPTMGLRNVRQHVGSLMRDLAAEESKRDDDRDWRELKLDASGVLSVERVVQKIRDAVKQRNRKHCYAIIDFGEIVVEGDIGQFLEQIVENAGRVCTTRSRGKVVALLGPRQVWNWLCSDARKGIEINPRVATMTVRRWSDGAIGNALDNIGRRTGSKAVGSEIFRLTAGVHALVSETLTQSTSLKGTDAEKVVPVAEKIRNELLESADKAKHLEELGIVEDGSDLQIYVKTLLGLWEELEGVKCLTEDSFDLAVEMLPQVDIGRNVTEQDYSRIIEWLRALDIVGSPMSAARTNLPLCSWVVDLLDTGTH